MEIKKYEPISIRIAPKEDFILKEVLSRVNEKKRTEFVKEAMFYWDYILRHSTLGTIRLNTDEQNKEVIEGLFPESYFKKRVEVDMSLKEKFKNVEIKPIRFIISEDEEELQEICSRAVNLDRFIEEAILEWDCLVNTSNVFLSRYIKRKKEATPEWHNITRANSAKVISSDEKHSKTENTETEPETKQETNTTQESKTDSTDNTLKKENTYQPDANITNSSENIKDTTQPSEGTKISKGRKNKMSW